MFGKSVFECTLSVLLTAALLSFVCERSLLQMADLEAVARSVSQPSWIRLAPRRAASCTVTLLVRSAGSPIILWYSTWAHGTRTATDRQTDIQSMLYLLTILFSTNFGVRLAATWTVISNAENCCGSACVRNVLFCSLRLSVQCTVCDPPAGSEQLPAVSVAVLHTVVVTSQSSDRTLPGDCPQTHCNSL
jgi:hypothetical protein